MERIQECLDEAKQILEEFDLKIVTTIEPTWNKRDGFDYVSQRVLAGDEVVYSSQSAVSLSVQDEESYDDFGIHALASCVAISENPNYRQQVYEFKSVLAKLMELRKNHKFTKGAEKKDLKEKCEELCYYGSLPSGENDSKRVNVPLLEDNLKNIKEALEKLKVLEAEKQAKAAQAGPANE